MLVEFVFYYSPCIIVLEFSIITFFFFFRTPAPLTLAQEMPYAFRTSSHSKVSNVCALQVLPEKLALLVSRGNTLKYEWQVI